jgi:hypothetical protein
MFNAVQNPLACAGRVLLVLTLPARFRTRIHHP